MTDSAQTAEAMSGQLMPAGVATDATPSIPSRFDPDNAFELLPWVCMLNRIPDLAGEIGERIANGERLWDIARHYGVKRRQLKRWIDADPERIAEYNAGLEAMADELAMDTIDVVREATMENVPLAKLKTDVYFRFAGKVDRKKWGDDSKAVNVGVGVKIVMSRDDVGLL